MGIAAKNGILIVEFAKQLKSEGKKSYNALISSCKRFRLIIMTGLSTVVSILIIGSGLVTSQINNRDRINIWYNFSVLLTLYITPYFFKVIDDQKVRVNKIILSKKFSSTLNPPYQENKTISPILYTFDN